MQPKQTRCTHKSNNEFIQLKHNYTQMLTLWPLFANKCQQGQQAMRAATEAPDRWIQLDEPITIQLNGMERASTKTTMDFIISLKHSHDNTLCNGERHNFVVFNQQDWENENERERGRNRYQLISSTQGTIWLACHPLVPLSCFELFSHLSLQIGVAIAGTHAVVNTIISVGGLRIAAQ